MRNLVWRALALIAVLAAALPPWSSAAAPDAPTPLSPPPNYQLENFSPTLQWSNAPGATQYQIQVTPYNNDGPGVNLIRGLETSFTVPPPTPDAGNYILLPDMTYTWQVRDSDAAYSIDENDPSWGPWSAPMTFHTPVAQPGLLQPVAPATGDKLRTPTVTVQWSNGDTNIFYYEVQVSTDPQFRTGDDAVAGVWWNLVHGGVSQPPNSWTTPPLTPQTRYYWRVRPRVQGDGTPTGWMPTAYFDYVGPPPCCQAHASFDPAKPYGSQMVTVTGRLTYLDGTPIPGVTMRATWHYNAAPTVYCYGLATDANGESSCDRRMDEHLGLPVTVTVEFSYNGQTWTDTGTLYPWPG